MKHLHPAFHKTPYAYCLTTCASIQAYDWQDASITDDALIKFLAGSEQWLGSLGEVNIKKCHHVTRKLLAFLRSACPKLRKLAPSRWADHSALRDIAAFPCLEVSLGPCLRWHRNVAAMWSHMQLCMLRCCASYLTLEVGRKCSKVSLAE